MYCPSVEYLPLIAAGVPMTMTSGHWEALTDVAELAEAVGAVDWIVDEDAEAEVGLGGADGL